MLSQNPAVATEICRPTLLLDSVRARANLDRMLGRLAACQASPGATRLRPHFKTHQSAAIGEWFRERGVTAITVSSVDMARYFAAAGWRDITIAVPVNPHQIDALTALSRQVRLGLLADDPAVLAHLPASWPGRVTLWIKIDVGSARAGLPWDDAPAVVAMAGAVKAHPGLQLAGLLAHAGHTYHAGEPAEVDRIHRTSVAHLLRLREHLLRAGHAPIEISVGDTPSCSLATDFRGVAELRPGNFIFYDLMQMHLGACTPEQTALAVLCPVTGRYPRRRHLNLYGGAVHLCKEGLTPRGGPFAGRTIYGLAVDLEAGGLGRMHADAALVGLSQEHGTLEVSPALFDRIQLGDWIAVSPVHACLTANLYREYRTCDGRRLTRLTSLDEVE